MGGARSDVTHLGCGNLWKNRAEVSGDLSAVMPREAFNGSNYVALPKMATLRIYVDCRCR
jgi:hypothetical protein